MNGKISRKGLKSNYYYSFFDDVFERNQLSPFPSKRSEAYTLNQAFWYEVKKRVEEEGLE